jgi:hypothetical protein
MHAAIYVDGFMQLYESDIRQQTTDNDNRQLSMKSHIPSWQFHLARLPLRIHFKHKLCQ